MKFRRMVSGLLLGTGCAVAFIGLLAIVLPRIDNARLQVVLASFRLQSTSSLVCRINKTMCFAFDQSWQVFATGLLTILVGLIPFNKTHHSPPSAGQSATPVSTEANNPFASVHYSEHETKSQSVVSFRAKPILEPNRIEAAEEEKHHTPYFSPRYTAETQSIETTPGMPSQSGHYILIRPVQDTPVQAEPETPALNQKPAQPPVSADVSSKPLIKPAASLRIRSTMGRHDSVNGKISSSRS